ncbi:MAG: agmatine deiminase family protein [Verrucomicrobia bacterium]|nr:agmatine deiminase family protein [Verrucomicrobiota bacterium]
MPAEWEPHEATWLTWPHRGGVSFPGKFAPIPAYWVKMAELLSPHERVHIVVHDAAHEAEVRRLLAKSRRIRRDRVMLHRFGCDECWARDHGPVFVVRKSKIAIVDWLYNAWGRKYPSWDLDDAIPQHVARLLGVPLFSPGMVLEGGSIDVNGRGTLLTTRSVLLNKNRNPRLTQRQIEQRLRDHLGVTRILWLGDGIVGDDTDGHVDDIARFVGPRTVVACVEDDPADPNYKPLQENLKLLRTAREQDGRPLRVLALPMPGVITGRGQRLPASYANFYIANRVVLVPVFSHPNDRRALAILRRCFPSRRVVGIECTDLVWGLGALHCVTQQQPSNRRAR